MPLWEYRSTFLLSWVVDLPDNRESFAKADLPGLCKHDSSLTQAGTYPRDPLELILQVKYACLEGSPTYALIFFTKVNDQLISGTCLPVAAREARASRSRLPHTCLVSQVTPSLLDGDRVLPLCVGYRLLPGTFLREGSQRLPTALQLCSIINFFEVFVVYLLQSFSWCANPFCSGYSLWSCQPFNIGKL